MKNAHKHVLATLKSHAKFLHSEWKYLDKQIERATRHAPPFGAHRKVVDKLISEQRRFEKMMGDLEKVIAKFPKA